MVKVFYRDSVAFFSISTKKREITNKLSIQTLKYLFLIKDTQDI